jgi:glycosyltransferase involved in cell wall biosynthesis
MYIVQMINALRVGGAEKLIVTFAQAAQKRDIELVVVTLRPNVPEVQAQVESYGVRVEAFNNRKIQAPGRFLELTRFLRRERPDIIHTHLTMANILGASCGLLTGIPVVATLHNTAMSTSDKLVLSSVETFMLRNIIQRIIAVGWKTAEAHQARFGGKSIDVIPNAVTIPTPVDEATRQESRVKLTGDPTLPILLSVSRLEPQKGVFDLIEAFAQVGQSRPDARLVIVGSGSLEGQVKAKIGELGLTQSVHMLGLRQDVPDILAAGDIFVSAAHWDGLPVASLEAMASGLPLVVTAVGDLPRVVLPGTGLLVEPRNPSALAEGILRFLEDPEMMRNSGKEARNQAINHYSADVWMDRLLEVYAQTTSQKPSFQTQVRT